jgi:hypothetical protein
MTTPAARRKFLTRSAALTTSALFGASRVAAAEPPPEVRRIRLVHAPAFSLSPQYLAEALLRLEGFSEVEYVDQPMRLRRARSSGRGRSAVSSSTPRTTAPGRSTSAA